MTGQPIDQSSTQLTRNQPHHRPRLDLHDTANQRFVSRWISTHDKFNDFKKKLKSRILVISENFCIHILFSTQIGQLDNRTNSVAPQSGHPMLHRVPSEPNHPTSSFQIQRKDEIFKNFRASYIFFQIDMNIFIISPKSPISTSERFNFTVSPSVHRQSLPQRQQDSVTEQDSHHHILRKAIYNIISPISSSIWYIWYPIGYSNILKFLKKVLIMMNQDLSHLNQFFK